MKKAKKDEFYHLSQVNIVINKKKIKYIKHLLKIIAAFSAKIVVVNTAWVGCNSTETWQT